MMKRTRRLFAIGFVLVNLLSVVLTGCSSARPEVSTATTLTTQSTIETTAKPVAFPTLTIENYPVVDGSTVTIPLSEGAAAKVLGITVEETRSFVIHNKTHLAYENLINKKADIIFVTSPSPDEEKLAKDKGITMEIIPVVQDAFVFLVNDKNPIQNLSTAQIMDIYQGRTTNWKEVGGADGDILAYQRQQNSGSQTLMESLFMKGKPLMKAPSEMMPMGMGELVEMVSAYDNSDRAIGYTVYYYANDMYMRDNVRFLSVDGVLPSDESIQSGKYPYNTAYYAVLRSDEPANSPARALLAWMLSAEGQQMAKEAGYVPMP